jgi:Fe-S-cluster containining protein
MNVRVLSFHATYGCRDSGVCCRTAWPIPVERDRIPALQTAWGEGRLGPASAGEHPLRFLNGAPGDTPAVLASAGAHCVFYDTSTERHCRVHRALGHHALPLACRQFPRVTVQTPAGASVTLSHYCPTAADLLRGREAVSIRTNVTAFPPDGEYVGLDARDSLPPLLRPDVLMDWSAWSDWEEASVDLVANASAPPEAVLAQLRLAVEEVRNWQPGATSLSDAIRSAFENARHERVSRVLDWNQLVDDVLGAVPVELRAQIPSPSHQGPSESNDVKRRFLAAHAFANWTAHLGLGLRSWLRSLEAAYALLAEGYGPGGADLLLRHLSDVDVLARTWSRAES